jgi:hypothetical protein
MNYIMPTYLFMLAFVNFSAISSNAQINPANTINLTADNENAIKVLSQIFDDEINDKDEKNDWKLIIVGDKLGNYPKVSCDLKNVPKEIAATLICDKVGFGYEILDPYFVVKVDAKTERDLVKIIFLGRIDTLFGGIISEAQSNNVISEKLAATFDTISNEATKGATITYSASDRSILVRSSDYQYQIIESIIALDKIGVLFGVIKQK